ncbi:putative bacteriophage protein [Shigella sonnei]|nr:putative bacteriophage protein [Shigella sonnei]
MIYPTNTGKSGEHLRLTTLESVWIQGKLRMWGRWSYIGGGKTGNMFNLMLTSKKLTKTAINEALRRMKKAGLNKSELAAAMKQIKELQRLLGKKTMENELLKEAVEYGRAKKWIAHAPLLPGDGE